VNLWAASTFTGSVPRAAGIWLHPAYEAGAAGTITNLDMIKGMGGTIATAGKITNFSWLNLPNVANVTNFYHMILGAGRIRAEGDLEFYGDDAAKRAWNIGKTSGTFPDVVNLGYTKLSYGSQASPAADNLLRNANFEYDLDGDGVPDYWEAAGDGFSRVTSQAHMGKYGVSLNKTSDYGAALATDYIPIDVDLVYELRVEWYCDAANNGSSTALGLALLCYDANLNYLDTARAYWTGTTTPTRAVFRVTDEDASLSVGEQRFAANTRFVKVRLGNHGAANSKTYIRWEEFKPAWRWAGEGTTGGTVPPRATISDPCIRGQDYVLVSARSNANAWHLDTIALQQFRVQSSVVSVSFYYEVIKYL
jgi:hypothetical protein